MATRRRNRRINGPALEQIMRDVLAGMREITSSAGTHEHAGAPEIQSVEQAPEDPTGAATVIPFPARRR